MSDNSEKTVLTETPKIFGDAQPAPEVKNSLKIPEELTSLIGEGKKYKDVETALLSIPHAQEHIENLVRTQAELREDLAKRTAAEEILQRIEDRTNSTLPQGEGGEKVQPADVEKMLDSLLSKRKEKETYANNVSKVEKEMIAKYGEKAHEVTKAKALELGLSLEELQNLAGRSPQAFMSNFSTLPSQEVNQDKSSTKQADLSGGNNKEKNFSYYQELKKADINRYYSPAVQREMFEAAKKAKSEGRNFYS